MRQDFTHLERSLAAAIAGLGRLGPDGLARPAASTAGEWVSQVASLVDVGGLPVMAREGAVETLADEIRVGVLLRSRNGAGALVHLRLGRESLAPLPPLVAWSEGQGRPRSASPAADGLRALFAGRQPVRLVELGFIEALRAEAGDVGYRALGDGIVEVVLPTGEDGHFPLMRLAEIARLADAHGATLALPAPAAAASRHLRFEVDGPRCLRKPRVPRPPVWGPLDLPLQADGVPVKYRPPRTIVRREVEPWPQGALHVGYRALEGAADTLLRLAVEDAKLLPSALADASTISRAGGTTPNYTNQLRRSVLQQMQKAWSATYVVPLARMRGNELARALADAMPDVARASDLGAAVVRMGRIVRELPEGTSFAGHASRAVRFLEAATVVSAALDEIVARPVTSKAPDLFEPGRPQPDVGAKLAALRDRIPALVAHAGLGIDADLVLSQAERLLAESPQARLEGFDVVVGPDGAGSIRLDLSEGMDARMLKATVGPDKASIRSWYAGAVRTDVLWTGERHAPAEDLVPAAPGMA